MSCNFLGSTCTDTSPCCDGFNCNTGGVCDFYSFSSTQNCPKGYSKVYTSDNAGICAIDLKTQGGWLIWVIIIFILLAILGVICFTIYKIIKNRKLRKH